MLYVHGSVPGHRNCVLKVKSRTCTWITHTWAWGLTPKSSTVQSLFWRKAVTLHLYSIITPGRRCDRSSVTSRWISSVCPYALSICFMCVREGTTAGAGLNDVNISSILPRTQHFLRPLRDVCILLFVCRNTVKNINRHRILAKSAVFALKVSTCRLLVVFLWFSQWGEASGFPFSQNPNFQMVNGLEWRNDVALVELSVLVVSSVVKAKTPWGLCRCGPGQPQRYWWLPPDYVSAVKYGEWTSEVNYDGLNSTRHDCRETLKKSATVTNC